MRVVSSRSPCRGHGGRRQSWRSCCVLALFLAFVSGNVWADDDADTIQLFKNAGQSGAFFAKSYGYAVFPTIGKAGLGVGGAHGSGHVYEKGKVIGETSMTQLSIGLQAGGEAYSEIIFFQDKRSLDEFTGGNFEFGAGVSAIAITSAAGAETGTSGSSAGASRTAPASPGIARFQKLRWRRDGNKEEEECR